MGRRTGELGIPHMSIVSVGDEARGGEGGSECCRIARMSRGTEMVRVASLGVDFEVLAGDAIIGPAIARGMWEEHETRLFRAHLRPACRVLDVGANVGWFGVQAVIAGCEVHCFEPVPAIAEVCERNLERAMKVGTGRAVLHRCAAGSERGSAVIELAAANFGDNRVVDSSGERPADMGVGERLEIRVERVDELVKGPVRVVKIDTQGSEWHALQGMRGVIDASPSVALLLEFWPYALRGAKPETLLDFLVALAFTVGKATAAPYPMTPARILRQARARDPVKGGLDLYAVRGLPFHIGGLATRLRGMARNLRED
jgi:FkbM family methyltransferase